VCSSDLVIDTREQSPWCFPEHLLKAVRGTLKTGDYALENDLFFAIERKSLGDFLGTIGTGWDRFQKEINRMVESNFVAKVIIVEGDFQSCCFTQNDGNIEPPKHDHFRLTPGFVCMRIGELTMMGVSILFAGNADQASALAYQILKQRWIKLNTFTDEEF
jgi:hypothetical protein